MIKFVQYSTNVGYFVKNEHTYYNYSYILNGKDASECPVANGYTQLDQPLTSVKQLVKGKQTILCYKLKDEELCCAKLPLTVEGYIDDDDNIQGKGVEGYFSLYGPVYSQTEDQIQEVEFEIINKGSYEISDPFDIVKRKVKYEVESGFASKIVEQELASVVVYDDIIKIITPEFALQQSPCKLTSKQMYSIVRQYIKENINYKENSITSDYDFCFTVKKRVHTKPFVTTESYLKGKSWKDRKVTKTEKLVEVFEMTWKGYKGNSGYDGYTCIPQLEGDNLQDLTEKLDIYLENLIAQLNTTVVECDCCKGTGHLITTFKH